MKRKLILLNLSAVFALFLNSTELESYELEATVIEASLDEASKYNSGSTLKEDFLEATPKGNGDITSILKALPNVQYDITQQRSTTVGEIDPAKISISGGLFYQNNFMLDGFNINNDINPMGTAGFYGGAKGHTQGFNIDTSLLSSIKVLDSNIGAEYGGFMGGVIEAETKKPSKDFGVDISYQITQGNANGALSFSELFGGAFSLTNYHIHEANADSLANFLHSNTESNQPRFVKHIIRTNVEGKINDKFSFLASFSTIQSIIPLYAASQSTRAWENPLYDSPVNSTDDANAKHKTKRKSYNVFLKGYYDFTPNLRTELSYTFAPQHNTYSVNGAKNQFYTSILGGHQVGSKTTYDNALGTLTHQLGYSFMQNSTKTVGYTNHKFWIMSEAKNWTNWNGYIRDGAYAPYDSTQHTINNKIIQHFKPIEDAHTIHNISLGIEFSYQYVQNSNPRLYFASSHVPRPMTQAQQALCLQTNLQWCDASKVYITRSSDFIKDDEKANYGDAIQDLSYNGRTLQVWQYGQFIGGSRSFLKGKKALNNYLGALFVEDDIGIFLKKFGMLYTRVGLRYDTDSYMSKFTIAPRLSISYELPWNVNRGGGLATSLSTGLNRYYGRNIFAYALADIMNGLRRDVTRSNPNVSFESILQSGELCPDDIGTRADAYDFNCIYTTGKNTTKFNKLKIPYVDEFMVGFNQNLFVVGFGAKYIHRKGKDEIRRSTRTVSNLALDDNFASNYYIYTNEGKSTSDVISVSVENTKPFEFSNTTHHFLFAFDYTNVKRNYTDYTDTLINEELANQMISYNGKFIKYADKPATNFNRPYTLRLSSTHYLNLKSTKWLLNSFLRYRSAYKAMASIPEYYGSDSRYVAYARRYGYPDKFNGVYVDTFRPFHIKGAFTWDLRVGFEKKIIGNHIFYMNVDIFNVLDAKNLAIATATASATAGTTATPIYEVGRQFWLQVGYKY